MEKITMPQGDSLRITFKHSTNPIDPIWENWSGKWSISETIGGPAVLEGSLLLDATPGIFYLRIGPATTFGWTTLEVGTWYLTAEINNYGCDYKKEQKRKLVIEPQGVANA